MLPKGLQRLSLACHCDPLVLSRAIASLDGMQDVPGLNMVFDEMKRARPSSITAPAYYEAKVTEAAAMLLDWFTHLGGTMRYGDEVIDRYLAWHPVDHIRWELVRPASTGGAAEGARFRIVEAFGGRPEYHVDVVDRVEKLDATGIRLVQRVAGVIVFCLEHTWSAGAEGAHYVSVLDVGARSAIMTPVNRVLARRFPDDMVRAWVKHNIEEVGQLEFLLPQLVPVS